MEEFLEKIEQAKNQVHLDPARKAVLKSEIVRSIDLVRQLEQVGQPQRSLFNTFILKTMPIIAYVLILAVVGGGVSAAAEGSLPGDALYAIKVKVNEEVRAALAATVEAKAEWEARRAERRLEEAAKIETKEDLSAEKKAELKVELEQRFEKHAQRTKERITDLEAKGKVEVAAKVAERFEASLKAHEAILGAVSGALGDVSEIKIELKLKAAEKAAKEEKEGKEDDDDDEDKEKGPATKAAAEGKIGAAANVIAATKNFIELKKEKLGAAAVADAEIELKKAEELLVQANTKLQAGVYAEAFELAQDALEEAQDAKAEVETEAEAESKTDGEGKGRSGLKVQIKF